MSLVGAVTLVASLRDGEEGASLGGEVSTRYCHFGGIQEEFTVLSLT